MVISFRVKYVSVRIKLLRPHGPNNHEVFRNHAESYKHAPLPRYGRGACL